METLKYSLDSSNYTWSKTLGWGLCAAHASKVYEGKLGERIVHFLIAAVESIPLIGQIASLFEKIIVSSFVSERPPQAVASSALTAEPVPGAAEGLRLPPPPVGEATQTSAPASSESMRALDIPLLQPCFKRFYLGDTAKVKTNNAVSKEEALVVSFMGFTEEGLVEAGYRRENLRVFSPLLLKKEGSESLDELQGRLDPIFRMLDACGTSQKPIVFHIPLWAGFDEGIVTDIIISSRLVLMLYMVNSLLENDPNSSATARGLMAEVVSSYPAFHTLPNWYIEILQAYMEHRRSYHRLTALE